MEWQSGYYMACFKNYKVVISDEQTANECLWASGSGTEGQGWCLPLLFCESLVPLKENPGRRKVL